MRIVENDIVLDETSLFRIFQCFHCLEGNMSA